MAQKSKIRLGDGQRGPSPKLAMKALSYSLLLMLSATATAQQTAAEQENAEASVLEEIVVTGIRASITRALDKKRNAANISDGIAAEDIGKFPDQNVAEALQRVTGITIDRRDGEGREVTVRGFGSNFNLTTLNGRSVATESGSRTFFFDTVAAELISGATVEKTSLAYLNDGAIGGTVDLTTLRPLDAEEGHGYNFSLGTDYNDLSDEFSPELFGSWTYNNGEDFAIVGSLSYQDIKRRVDSIDYQGWQALTPRGGFAVTGAFDPNSTPQNDQRCSRLSPTERVSDGNCRTDFIDGAALASLRAPNKNYQEVFEQDRQRIGASLTAQFRPNDDLTLTLDGLFTTFDVESQSSQVGSFLDDEYLYNAAANGNGTVTQFSRVPRLSIPGDPTRDLPGFSNGTLTNSANARGETRDTDLSLIGLNADWQLTERLNIELDLSHSEAKSDTTGANLAVASRANGNVDFSLNGDNLYSVSSADNFAFAADTSAYLLNYEFQSRNDISDKIDELKLHAKYDLEMGPVTQISTGLFYSDRSIVNDRFTTPNDFGGSVGPISCLHCSFRALIPANVFEQFFPSGFLGGSGGDLIPGGVRFDPDALLAYAVSDEALRQFAASASGETSGPAFEAALAGRRLIRDTFGSYAPIPQPQDSFQVDEETVSFYISANLAGELGGRPWAATVGARYVDTENESRGFGRDYVGTIFSTQNASAVDQFTDNQPIRDGNSYSEVLPSLNIRLDLTDDLLLRFAASKSLARAPIGRLRPASLRVDTSARTPTGSGTINSGNPRLNPTLSTNFDVSLEWYFNEASVLAVTYFDKDLEDFIVRSTQEVPLFDSINNETRLYSQTAFFNAAETGASGVEIAYNQIFNTLPAPFDGLGVQASATFIDSDAEFDPNSNQEVTIFGVSDESFTASVFYEKGPIQARLAYTQRGESALGVQSTRGTQHPLFLEEYGQLDFSASYQWNDNLQVTLAAINLTEEQPRTFSELSERTVGFEHTGTFWSLGVRGNY